MSYLGERHRSLIWDPFDRPLLFLGPAEHGNFRDTGGEGTSPNLSKSGADMAGANSAQSYPTSNKSHHGLSSGRRMTKPHVTQS